MLNTYPQINFWRVNARYRSSSNRCCYCFYYWCVGSYWKLPN